MNQQQADSSSCTATISKVPFLHCRISLRSRLARLFSRHLLCCWSTSRGHYSSCQSRLYTPHLADCPARNGRCNSLHLFQYCNVPKIAHGRGFRDICSCLWILCIRSRPLVCIIPQASPQLNKLGGYWLT